jgi:hypothetical protein
MPGETSLTIRASPGAMLSQGLFGKRIQLARLRIAFDCRIEPHGVGCKDRNTDTCAPARSVLAESFNERSVDLRDRRRDDVVGRFGIDHHMGAEMIALQVFLKRSVSPLADFRDVGQPAIHAAATFSRLPRQAHRACSPEHHVQSLHRTGWRRKP